MIKDNAKEFAPAKHLGWVELFTRNYLDGERATKGAYQKLDLIVDDGSMYQAQFDEAKDSAGRLINQSVIAANNIANDMGVEGIALPANAGELLADKKAVINDGVYMQEGSFIYVPEIGSSPADIHLLRMMDGVLTATKMSKMLYARASEPSFRIYHQDISNITVRPEYVVNANDSRYLDVVKQAAAFEDLMIKESYLKPDTDCYSTYLPMIAEYRDKNTQAEWGMSHLFIANHHGLTGGKIAIVLPSLILEAGTPFAKAALTLYEKNGIHIDLEKDVFTLSDDKISVEAGKHRGVLKNSAYAAAAADIVRLCGVKLTDNDEHMMKNQAIMLALSKTNADGLLDAIDAAIKSINADTDHAELHSMIGAMYDRFCFDPAYMTAKPSIAIQMGIVSALHPEYNALRGGGVDVLARLEKVLDEAVTVKKAKEINGGVDINDADAVYVTGETKTHKDAIKRYGENYGSNVTLGKRTARYIYVGKMQAWIISYSAWKKIISDYPSLADQLSIQVK